jgi:glycosyltransferase involved in cell wall biosynthesis
MTNEFTAQYHSLDIAGSTPSFACPAWPEPARTTTGRAGRIAIIFQDFAAGGTERIMIRLANQWAQSRDVAIFCGSEKGPARALVSPAVTMMRVSPATPRSPLSRWKLGRRLAPMLREWCPDVIVGPGNHILPVILASGTPIAPIICKLSNPIDPAGHSILPSAVLARARRRVCAPLSRIVAMSPALGEEASSYLRTDRVIVIDEPILTSVPKVRRRPKFARTSIMFAGRLVAQKNVSLALRTLAELPGDITLAIVGDGPDRTKLEAQARRLGIDSRVTFTGPVPDIAPHLAEADIFLLPSRFEGYPAVLIEALAAGLPVVTTPCSPAMPEIVSHGSFGRIAAADPITLAAAILALENSDGPDPELLQPLLERHSLVKCAADWLRCLDEAASGGSLRP